MKLVDVVTQLSELNANASIFAAKIDGTFTSQSPARIVLLTSEESDKSLDVVADAHCPGMVYLVDVDIARGIIDSATGDESVTKTLALIAYVVSG